jgi:hypothetical protein
MRCLLRRGAWTGAGHLRLYRHRRVLVRQARYSVPSRANPHSTPNTRAAGSGRPTRTAWPAGTAGAGGAAWNCDSYPCGVRRTFSGQLLFVRGLWRLWRVEPSAGHLYRHIRYWFVLDDGNQPNVLRVCPLVRRSSEYIDAARPQALRERSWRWTGCGGAWILGLASSGRAFGTVVRQAPADRPLQRPKPIGPRDRAGPVRERPTVHGAAVHKPLRSRHVLPGVDHGLGPATIAVPHSPHHRGLVIRGGDGDHVAHERRKAGTSPQ